MMEIVFTNEWNENIKVTNDFVDFNIGEGKTLLDFINIPINNKIEFEFEIIKQKDNKLVTLVL